ncbi:MAG TPA: hypothetical protein VN840_00255 [Streptosporangiaceae bacterium]|nr:hypothetical protein [Streptosporangiaceae bacterium]
MENAADVARSMWTMFEPVHAVTYFAPEARAAFEQAGLRGFWRGYFAGRAAPLGAVKAAPVTASFYNFAPPMVSRALPAVWDLVPPSEALAVRSAGAVAALSRLLAGLGGPARAAAGLLTEAVAGLDCAGRVLAAANTALPVPDEPVTRLWHAATVLREHRGDGHFAALLAADIDGCEALVLRATDMPRAQLQPLRGWTDAEWEGAAGRLADRGLIGADGLATPAGAELRAAIERATDAAAARPWSRLGPAFAAELAGVLAPISLACSAELPYPNPIGVSVPARTLAASAGSGRQAGDPR